VDHYLKLEVKTAMKKRAVQIIILKYLVSEEVFGKTVLEEYEAPKSKLSPDQQFDIQKLEMEMKREGKERQERLEREERERQERLEEKERLERLERQERERQEKLEEKGQQHAYEMKKNWNYKQS